MDLYIEHLVKAEMKVSGTKRWIFIKRETDWSFSKVKSKKKIFQKTLWHRIAPFPSVLSIYIGLEPIQFPLLLWQRLMRETFFFCFWKKTCLDVSSIKFITLSWNTLFTFSKNNHSRTPKISVHCFAFKFQISTWYVILHIFLWDDFTWSHFA